MFKNLKYVYCIGGIVAELFLGGITSYAQCSAVIIAGHNSGCSGTSVTLSASSYQPGVTGHKWYTSATGSSEVQSSGSNQGGDIYVSHHTETNASNKSFYVAAVCNGSVSSSRTQVKLTTTQGTGVSITANPLILPQNYCQGDEVSLTASGSGVTGFTWTRSGVSYGGGATIYPTLSGNYVVQATNNCGQMVTNSFPVNFEPPLGSVAISYNGGQFCKGTKSTTPFNVTASNYTSLVWSVSGEGNYYSSSEGKVFWDEDFFGTSTVSVTAIGCHGTSRTASSNFTIYPEPTVSLVPESDVILCGENCNTLVLNESGFAYQWFKDGNILEEETDHSILACEKGNYSVLVTEGVHNCSSWADFKVKYDWEEDPSLICDDALNWIQADRYDDEGFMYSSGKSYYDQAGRSLQGQTVIHNSSGDEVVFASENIYDRYDRAVGSTLSAPILGQAFQYQPFLLTTSDPNQKYSYNYFHLPVGHDTPGTIGWYYGENNTLEDHVPVTDYPYSRSDFYSGGTGGETRRSASAGDVHRLGQGHEVVSGTFPVFNELEEYLDLRRSIGLLDNRGSDYRYYYEGIQTVVRDQNGIYAISIADREGRTVMAARPGSEEDHDLMVENTIGPSLDMEHLYVNAKDYFYLLQPYSVQTSPTPGYYKITNILTDFSGDLGSFNNPDGKMQAGFYSATIESLHSQFNLKYKNYFKDVSYMFYDDAGRLKYSISPNGVKQLKAGENFADIDKTAYTYDFQGRVLSVTEKDAGTSAYIYRKDGSIRFSQNAQQQLEGHFSYTNYDPKGRPIESGEYVGTSAVFNRVAMSGMLEYDQQIFWPAADTKDWVKTHYDYPADSIPYLPAVPYTQQYTRGGVSWTENENMTTWYSYDELGRVTWMAQKPRQLNRTFVLEYQYDFLGNVLEVHSVTFWSGAPRDEFYHHYEYDLDKRLSTVYSSTDGQAKKLRAKYHYYLHGPLKRIELGDQLQGIDFVYNINGWLTQINHPDVNQDPGGDGSGNGFRADVFGMLLNYYESDFEGLYGVLFPGAPDPYMNLESANSMYMAQVTAEKEPVIPSVLQPADYSPEKPHFKNMLVRYFNQEMN